MNIIRGISSHKIATGILAVAVLGGGYYGFFIMKSKTLTPVYQTAVAELGTIVITVSGSGQVSASNQVDISPKVSGEIIVLPATEGQDIKAGALIAQLDARTALKSVRDAQANLESAKISLNKLLQPADALSITQSENTLVRAQEAKQNATADLVDAYEDGFTTVSNAFLDLPSTMTGLHDSLYTNTAGLGSNGQWNIDFYTDSVQSYNIKAIDYKQDVVGAYSAARAAYDAAFERYKTLTRSSDAARIESLISETYETTRYISEAVKSATNLIQFYKDVTSGHGLKPAVAADTQLSNMNSYLGQVNTHLQNLLSAKNTILNDRDAIVNADRTITENTQSLAKLKAGTDSLDLASSRLSVQQRENSLRDAQETLADYVIRAPFDGTIAVVNSKISDQVGSGTAIATLITKQKIAEIALNEIDAATIKVGQKVTLGFDAVEDLAITGLVASVDALGTVSQGVVNYTVRIAFDTQDERVKPGMSVAANIIIEAKPDVILVPSSAVKSEASGGSYVEIMDGTGVRSQPVSVGLSNDTLTEITNGLTKGTVVITQTISAAQQTQTTQQTQSIFQGLGGGGQSRSGTFAR